MKIEIFAEHHGSMLPFVTFINPVNGEFEFKASGGNVTYKGKAIISETEEETEEETSAE